MRILLEGSAPAGAWELRSAAGGVAVVILMSAAGFNRNALYLGLLLSTHLLWSLAVSSRTRLVVALGALTGLAAWPFAVPEVSFRNPGSGGARYRTMRPDEVLSYTFHLESLAAPKARRLVVDGRMLEGLQVTVAGQEARAGEYRAKYDLQQLRIPLPETLEGVVPVVLRAREGTAPRLFQGAEVHGAELYSDAVFVEVGDERSTIVHHALRTKAR
jgi:hypothetical protein